MYLYQAVTQTCTDPVGGTERVWTPLGKFQSYRFLSNTGTDSPKNHKGTRLAFNVGPTACIFVLRIRVEFKLRMKRESMYFETHEYSLTAPKRVSTVKYAFLPNANQIVLLQRSDA